MVQLRLAELVEFTVLHSFHSQGQTPSSDCNGQMIDSTPTNQINDHVTPPCHEGDSRSQLYFCRSLTAILLTRNKMQFFPPELSSGVTTPSFQYLLYWFACRKERTAHKCSFIVINKNRGIPFPSLFFMLCVKHWRHQGNLALQEKNIQ